LTKNRQSRNQSEAPQSSEHHSDAQYSRRRSGISGFCDAHRRIRCLASRAHRAFRNDVPFNPCFSEALVAGWRKFFAEAVMTTDRDCIDMIIDEATNALDRRLEELAEMPATKDSRKVGEESPRREKTPSPSRTSA
jgi:hypothetical protein